MANRSYYDDYGVQSGYNQTAPGRDVAPVKPQGQPGRPRTATPPAVANAIMPQAQTTDAQPQGIAPTAPPPISDPMGQPVTPAPHYNTQLMEGDPSKFTAEHMAKSPKYDFLNLARSNKYNYNQMGDMLKELQGGANGRLWQGWTADGKGNLVFAGDPAQLAQEWNGVRRVDAVGSYGNMAQGKAPQGWRWGAEDPNAPQGLLPGVLQGAIAGGSAPNYLDPAALSSAIAASGVPGATDYTERIKQQIQAALMGKL